MRQVTDPAGKATDYQFDDLGRLAKVTSPNTGVTLYLYDLAGYPVAKKEDLTGTPRTTLYAYDGLDRLTGIDFPSDADWAFSYDGSAALNQKGRLTSAGNGTVTTELEYTDSGEIAVERMPIGGASYAVSYGYDAGGKPDIAPDAERSYHRLRLLRRPAEDGDGHGRQRSAGHPEPRLPPLRPAHARRAPALRLGHQREHRHQHALLQPARPGLGARGDLARRHACSIRASPTATSATLPAPCDGGPNLDRVVDNRDSTQSRFYFYDDSRPALEEHRPRGHADLHLRLRRERQPHAAGRSRGHHQLQLRVEHRHASRRRRARARSTTPTTRTETASGRPDGLRGLAVARLRPEQPPRRGARPGTQAVLGQYTYDAAGRRVRKIAGGVTTLFFYDSAGHLRRVAAISRRAQPRGASYVFVEDEPVGRGGPAAERLARLLVDPHRPARDTARGDQHAGDGLGAGDLARDLRALRPRDAG